MPSNGVSVMLHNRKISVFIFIYLFIFCGPPQQVPSHVFVKLAKKSTKGLPCSFQTWWKERERDDCIGVRWNYAMEERFMELWNNGTILLPLLCFL